MRIAFGGYEHETNNFSSISVTGAVMDRIMRRDQELIDAFTGVQCMVGAARCAFITLG